MNGSACLRVTSRRRGRAPRRHGNGLKVERVGIQRTSLSLELTVGGRWLVAAELAAVQGRPAAPAPFRKVKHHDFCLHYNFIQADSILTTRRCEVPNVDDTIRSHSDELCIQSRAVSALATHRAARVEHRWLAKYGRPEVLE